MDAESLRRFARRDWEAVARSKSEHWNAIARERGDDELIRVADDLRRFALSEHPCWPSEEDRARDLETHIRVARALSIASARRHP